MNRTWTFGDFVEDVFFPFYWRKLETLNNGPLNGTPQKEAQRSEQHKLAAGDKRATAAVAEETI